MVPVVVVTDEGSLDCEIDGDADATVGGLVTALGLTGTIFVDGPPLAPELTLADVLTAGVVPSNGAATPGDQPSPGQDDAEREEHDRFRLVILAGKGAGMAVGLAEGRQVVGSGPGVTITLRAGGVADRHALLDVTAGSVHLVSRGGRRALDGDTVLAIGETLACVVPVPDAVRSPAPGGGAAIVPIAGLDRPRASVCRRSCSPTRHPPSPHHDRWDGRPWPCR